MKNAKTIRIVLNSVLLLAIVALGVTVYQAGTKDKREQAQLEEQIQEENLEADQEEEPSMVDAGTSDVQAQMGPDETAQAADDAQEEGNTSGTEEEITEETAQNEAASNMVEMETEDTADASAKGTGIDVNFTEDTLMAWPLNGDLVLDYNMENTIYFPTLNQYKLNPAIAVKSDVGSPVVAAANGTIASITEDAQTGLTVYMDMGNGYEAVYGQLKDLAVEEGQAVAQGTVLGYVNEPTKYYSLEGSNLYFAMKKDGNPIDPIAYLP